MEELRYIYWCSAVRNIVSSWGLSLPVDEGHLKFLLKIRPGPQALDDDTAAPGLGVIGKQPLRAIDLNIGQMPGGPLDHLHALSLGEHGALIVIEHHTDDELVKNAGGALDDIEVPIGDRVKATRVDCDLHSAKTPLPCRFLAELREQDLPVPARLTGGEGAEAARQHLVCRTFRYYYTMFF